MDDLDGAIKEAHKVASGSYDVWLRNFSIGLIDAWLRSIQEDGYRTDNERIAAEVLLKLSPAQTDVSIIQLTQRKNEMGLPDKDEI